jgi:hypothetical protein
MSETGKLTAEELAADNVDTLLAYQQLVQHMDETQARLDARKEASRYRDYLDSRTWADDEVDRLNAHIAALTTERDELRQAITDIEAFCTEPSKTFSDEWKTVNDVIGVLLRLKGISIGA